VQHRTIPGIATFTLGLLGASPSKTTTTHLIQSVTLPPHYLDKPDDEPKCKAFAFVTLFQAEDVEALLKSWPWERSSTSVGGSATKDTPESTEAREAAKFGLRVLSKRRWEQLKEEYLAYRSSLLEELVQPQNPSSGPHLGEQDSEPPSLAKPNVLIPPATLVAIHPSSPFPPNCLVFVRNIHPETNKTTLRALFSQAFHHSSNNDALRDDGGLDYVDFNKGMTSCHLRLATPVHTHILVDHFTSRRIIQSRGLDGTGTDADEGGAAAALVVEMVLGKREEVYWEKVPEKVRRQAVQKAVEATSSSSSRDEPLELERGKEHVDSERKRKRRKR